MIIDCASLACIRTLGPIKVHKFVSFMHALKQCTWDHMGPKWSQKCLNTRETCTVYTVQPYLFIITQRQLIRQDMQMGCPNWLDIEKHCPNC